MLCFSVIYVKRNKHLVLPILLSIILATSVYSSTIIFANLNQIGLVDVKVADTPVDMTRDFEENVSSLFHIRQLIESNDGVEETELVTRNQHTSTTNSIIITSIQSNSTLHHGLTLVDGSLNLETNETFILTYSSKVSEYPIGSSYVFPLSVTFQNYTILSFDLNLTVVGHVDAIENTQRTIIGAYGIAEDNLSDRDEICFVTSYDLTLLPLLQFIEALGEIRLINMAFYIHVYVDRQLLINPLNLHSSVEQVAGIGRQINNQLELMRPFDNHLHVALVLLSQEVEFQRIPFYQTALLIMFLSIYLALTINQLTVNMRRHEVGLFLVKGSSNNKISNLFILHAMIIGILGSTIGLIISIFAVFLLSGLSIGLVTFLLNPSVVLLTITIGFIIGLITVYFPIRKTSTISPVEALQEPRVLPRHIRYHRVLVWACIFLGGYKIITWIFGINILLILETFRFTNPLLAYFAQFWVSIDILLTFIGPLLFFWGIISFLIKGSSWFYSASSRFLNHVAGDLGDIASHSLRRHPNRTAAIMFLCAILMTSGIYTAGVFVSHQHFLVRQSYAEVGADLRAIAISANYTPTLQSNIENIEGVKAVACEYFLHLDAFTNLPVRAIDIEDWIQAAFCESTWFSGGSLPQITNRFIAYPNSIILEQVISFQYTVSLDTNIMILNTVNGTPLTLNVISFFGPTPHRQQQSPTEWTWVAEPTWSYISSELLQYIDAPTEGSVLIALQSPTFEDSVRLALENLEGIQEIQSAQSHLQDYQMDISQQAYINSLAFSFSLALLISILGIYVILQISLRERRRSLATIYARGSSLQQMVKLLSLEYLLAIGVALLLGLIFGLVMLYGINLGNIAIGIPTLISPQFLPFSQAGLFIFLLGIFSGGIILAACFPIFVEAHRARFDLSVLR